MTKTYTATIGGRTYTRRTDADYAYASYRDGRVAFHGTADAARRRGGIVVKAVRAAGPAERRVAERVERVAEEPAGCTIRYAVAGECGKPAVRRFEVGGRVYKECVDHAV